MEKWGCMLDPFGNSEADICIRCNLEIKFKVAQGKL
jgi:hypothetical protein